MKHKYKFLSEVCSIRSGIPASRANKNLNLAASTIVKVLTQKAMNDGMIIDSQLVMQNAAEIKPDFFTQAGDVVIKTATPYDCVYINPKYVRLLVTTPSIILRKVEKEEIPMGYIAAFLNLASTKQQIQALSQGTGIQLINKRTLEQLAIPVVDKNKMQQIEKIFLKLLDQKYASMKTIELCNIANDSFFEDALNTKLNK